MSKNKFNPAALKRKKRVGSIFYYTLLIVIAFICLFPFAIMIFGSFSTVTTELTDPFFWLPKTFTIENWKTFLTSPRLLSWVKNSIIFTIIPVASCVLTCPLIGYVLAKKRFKGRTFIFMAFMSMLFIPQMSIIVPQYAFFQKIGFLNNYAAILVPGIWSLTNVFLMRQYMASIPDSVLEAASIDGSGEFRTYFKIVFPMLKTPIAVMGVFTFLAFWAQFLNVTIFMSKAEMYNLIVGVATMIQKDGNFAMSMTSSVVTMLPVVLLYIFCQKFFIEGINLSGTKG